MIKLDLLFWVSMVIFAAKSAEIGPYGQRYEDKVMDQRLCVSLAAGFEYISWSLSAILTRYIRFYNDPQSHYYHRDKYDRFHQKVNNRHQNADLGLKIDLVHVDESVKGPVYVQQGKDLIDIIAKYPIQFIGNDHIVGGTIDFGLRLRINNTYSPAENKNLWHF